MTPRCFWDRDGYFWEISPCGELARVLWSPYTEAWEQDNAPWWDYEIAFRFHGPSVVAA